MSSYLFTSESVSEGHPDKVADQISDAVLDAILAQDKRARVACETMVKTGVAIVAGEITTTRVGRHRGARRARSSSTSATPIRDVGFDGATCGVLNLIGKQSPDINQGVDRKKPEEQGAGDQGLMFGYATATRRRTFMPAPIYYSHRLVEQQAKVRKKKNSPLPWLRPDAKSQVTLRYENDKAVGDRRRGAVDAARSGRQAEGPDRRRDASRSSSRAADEVARTRDTKFHINPTGKFVIGGPVGDCGLTGRKIIVDTYGGLARHGGGAFSGKDPSKVDRSAAYAARYVAKNIVAAGLADRCEVQVSLRDRRGPADVDLGDHLRHRQDQRRQDREADPQALRPAPVRHHQDARPGASDVPADRGLRPLRPHAGGGQLRRRRRQEQTSTAFSWEKTDKADDCAQGCGTEEVRPRPPFSRVRVKGALASHGLRDQNA